MPRPQRIEYAGARYHVMSRGNSPLVTGYGYDDMGRRTSVTLPDSTVTTTGYDQRGNVTSTGGSQQYDVTYTFDPQGRRLTMTTTGQAGPAVTTWVYNAQRGWLDRKEYADGKGTDYTYTPAGKLHTRTWARTGGGSPIVTTYGHNAAGELASTDYSDATPDVAMTYKRFGGLETVTDATGTRTIGYNALLQPETETLPAAFYGGRILARKYDTLHRPTGFELGTGADPDLDHEVSYGYDTGGRLATVADPDNTWNYTFVTNAPSLLSSVTNGAKTVSNTYEPGRNAVTSITNKVGTTTVSAYTYTNNAIGQRTSRSQSGTAFAASASEAFGYNAKGEVTSTAHSVDAARDTAFAYDGIGNRDTATFGGITTDYTANALNQYSEVDPGTPAIPTYDGDGNMLGDGTNRVLAYDGENRLVEVRDASNTLLATYTYDGQGRRVKRVTTSAAPQGASEEVYLYDGWNQIAKYNSSLTLQKTQTWGRDLSGTLEGAGGVGGLLGVEEHVGAQIGNYTVQFDANGNVSEVLNVAGGIAAQYEYDAFGNTVVATGSYAAANPWRFSTKSVDAETGYLYYGYRYYNPEMGRWLSRDPLGDIAFLSAYSKGKSWAERRALQRESSQPVYLFVSNNSINNADMLGLICGIKVHRKDVNKSAGDVGHQWIEYSGTTAGFLPVPDIVGPFEAVPGEPRVPDTVGQLGGTPDQTWETDYKVGLVSWPRLQHGKGKGKLNVCATCDEISDCVKEAFNALSGSTFCMPFRDCRARSAEVLNDCGLKRK